MTTTTYPNTAAGYAQAVAEHGEANLLVDPFAHTITVKPDDTAPTEVDAQTYVNQMPDEQLDWALDQAFGSSPDPDTRRTLFRKFFSSLALRLISEILPYPLFRTRSPRPKRAVESFGSLR